MVVADLRPSARDLLIAAKEYRVPMDLESLAAKLGVDVLPVSDWPNEFSGQVVYDGGDRPQVQYNTNHSTTRIRFTVAHELAHVVLHLNPGEPRIMPRDTTFRAASREEVEANLYAADLLIPLPLLHEVIEDVGRDYRRLAEIFTVSKQAMLYRLSAYDAVVDALEN